MRTAKLLKTVLEIILALAVILSVVGCANNNTESTNIDNNDFFTDTEAEIDGNTDSNASSSFGSTANESTANESTANGSSVNSSVTSSNANKVEGKSWQEILASMPKKLRGTTVIMYNWNSIQEYAGTKSVLEKFEKQTGIKVKWQTENYDTYISKLASMVASGNAPDVVRLRTPDPSGLISIQPLSTTGYDFSDRAWDQVLMKDYTYNGKVYGTSLKNTHIGSVALMMYNSSLISKYELEDPYQLWKKGKWTWDTFLNICRTYKKASGAEFAAGGDSGWTAWSQLFGVEGPVTFDGKAFKNNTSNEKFIKVTQEIADLYNTENLFANWKADEFNRGECLFWAGASVYARRQNSYHGSLKSAGTLKIVPMPSIPGQKYYQARGEYEAYGIAKGAKNAEAVPYVLRYYLDGGNYDLNSFFGSNQMLEVYNWCMSQENTIWSTYYQYNAQFLGGQNDEFSSGHMTLTASQVVSYLNSTSSVIDARVNKFNTALSKLK